MQNGSSQVAAIDIFTMSSETIAGTKKPDEQGTLTPPSIINHLTGLSSTSVVVWPVHHCERLSESDTQREEVTTMARDMITSSPWLTRPVFISSTFKDMQAERDYLRQVVFPRLEEELRKGRIILEPIDLRQGVETADLDDEAAREQLVLKVVLDEVKRSHPFLIVLLGDRYGWVPPEDRTAAAAQEAGFNTEIRDKSVTSLEIEYGILKQSPEQRHRSFFYFREPLPYSEMPEQVRPDYSDMCSPDSQTRARHSRLEALKQSLISDSELAPRVHSYHAEWDHVAGKVGGLEAWGEMVYRHLLDELREEIASAALQPPNTWEDEERAALAEFIDLRRRDFTGRQELLEDLKALALSETPPEAVFAIASHVTWGACLTGSPGSGKSAIFAELTARLRTEESVVLLSNTAGATPRGSQVGSMLDRFIQELATVLGIENPLPANASPDDVDATFASLLCRVAVKRRVVVLLDALNQFDPAPRAQHMTWLRPKRWPANARLIATAIPGVPAEALSQWAGIEELEVPPLTLTEDDTDDVSAIAKAVWKRYHRQMNPAVLKVLKSKQLPDGTAAAGNPLWLTLALEQINLLDADDFARAEREFPGSPAERQRAMQVDTAEQMPPSVTELYELLLAQSEKLFGAPAARAFAAVIAVSRSGWRESDLLALIHAAARVLCPDEPNPKLDALRLAAIRRSFRAHLSRCGALGQIDFFHAQMRQAVEYRTLGDPEQVQALHRVVADHLESMPPDDPLRDSELMVHLIAGDDPDRAARIYADLPKPSSALTAATQVLAQHVIRGAKDQPNVQTNWVTNLLTQPGLTHPQLATLALRFNINLHDAISKTADLATRQSLLLATCDTWQHLTDFAPEIETCQRELSVSLRMLGELAVAQGNLPEARRLIGEVICIRFRLAKSDPVNVQNQRDLAASLVDLCVLAKEQGNLPEAQQLLGGALHISQRLAESDTANAEWQRDLSVTLEKQFELATAKGNLLEAQLICGESHRIAQRLAGSDPANVEWQRDLTVSLIKLGDLAKAQGNLLEAQRLCGESLRIAQRLAESDPSNAQWQFDLGISNERLGAVAIARGDLAGAHMYYSAKRLIIQQLADSDPANAKWQRDLAVSLGKLGELAKTLGNLSEAERLCRESLRITRRLAESDPINAAWQRDLSVSLEKLGDLANVLGNLPEAQRLCGERHRIAQRLAESDPANVVWQRDLLMSLDRLGDLARTQRNLFEAQRLFSGSLRIAKRLADFAPANAVWQQDLAVSHCKLAYLAQDYGDDAGFQKELREGYSVLLQMQQRGMQFDPPMAQLYQQLAEILGG